MATRSITTLRAVGYDGPVAVVADPKTNIADSGVRIIPPRPERDSRAIKTRLDQFSPFDQSLYLDCDILATGPIDGLWRFLDQGDVALALDIRPTVVEALKWSPIEKRGSEEEWEATRECGERAPHFNGGVLLWRKSNTATKLFSAWHQEWARFGQIDQLALVRAIHRSEVRPVVLDPRFNFPSRNVRDLQDAVERKIALVHFWTREQQQRMMHFMAGERRSANDPRNCVILVPYSDHIVPQCDMALKELERRGYQVRRVHGFAAVDQARNQLATDALADGFEETMWIDADVGFHPDSVDVLRSHGLPLVSGIYPQKGKRAVACHVFPGTPTLAFGGDGGVHEILYAAGGFLLVRKEVYATMQKQLDLPTCNQHFGKPMVPYFLPLAHKVDEGWWYLAEDYAFCERARRCGYKILADTTVRLWHFGTYGYSWEDAGGDLPRRPGFTLNFVPKPSK